METRVGIGYDIHSLVEGRLLFVGGIEIPYVRGLAGHSDGDVLLHALCDALLGASGLGDIGEHFPDSDPQYQAISSIELLKTTFGMVVKKGLRIGNIDIVVIAQEPNFTPFKKPMRVKISQVLAISDDAITIKAKTNNGVGEVGRKEAIACYAAVLLIKE